MDDAVTVPARAHAHAPQSPPSSAGATSRAATGGTLLHLHLQPRRVPELIDDAAVLFRSGMRPFLLSGALIMIPTGVLQIILAFLVPAGDANATLAGSSLLQFAVFFLGLLVLTSAQIWIAFERWQGRQPDVRDAFMASRSHLLRMAGLIVLYVGALALMSVSVIGIPAAIFFGVAWALAIPVLVIERLAPRAALRRSRALIRGHWWRVVGLALVLTFVQIVVAFGFRLPGLFFGADSLFFNPGDDVPRLVVVADIIGNVAARIVVTPLSICAVVLLYVDQRVRVEGLDIEQHARELGFLPTASPPSPPVSGR